MTLYLDTSALVAAVVENPNRAVVLSALKTNVEWCASTLVLSESIALIPRLTDEVIFQSDIEDRASQIARIRPVNLNNAIHLAAAERLPSPVRIVTFDPAQIPIALGLGLQVISR